MLLIGDSITRQYRDRVRELLRGKCYVDYFSSSYAVDSPIYKTLIKAFVGDSKYAIIHFNNGLHGFHICQKNYFHLFVLRRFILNRLDSQTSQAVIKYIALPHELY